MSPEQVLTLLMEEYKTLRTQVLDDLDRQYSVTNWGVSAVAVAVIGVATAWDKLRTYPTVLLALLLVVLPTIVTSYVVAWSHILRSTLRAGRQLHLIEQRVARLFTDDELRTAFHLNAEEDVAAYRHVLSWEHGLRHGKDHGLVKPATWLVRVALALVYIAALIVSVLACRSVYKETLLEAIQRVEIFAALAGLVLTWLLVSQYLSRAAAVAAPPTRRLNSTPSPLWRWAPNAISCLRLVLVVPAITTTTPWVAASCVLLALITDYLDGAVARRFQLVTATGARLDIAVDKAFVLSLVIVLAYRGIYAWQIATIAIARDVVVEFIRQFISRSRAIPTNRWGRWKFVVQAASLAVAFLTPVFHDLRLLANLLLGVAVSISLPGVVVVVQHAIRERRAIVRPTA